MRTALQLDVHYLTGRCACHEICYSHNHPTLSRMCVQSHQEHNLSPGETSLLLSVSQHSPSFRSRRTSSLTSIEEEQEFIAAGQLTQRPVSSFFQESRSCQWFFVINEEIGIDT